MKKFLMFFILSVSYIGNAQDLKNWQLGLNINPLIFSRFDFTTYKSNQGYPNGLGYGLTIEKNWNDNWGLKSGIEFCSQKLTYKYFDGPNNQYTDNEIKTSYQYNYFKVPLTLEYSIPINEILFLTFNQGFQVSILNNYYVTYTDNLNFIELNAGKFQNTYYDALTQSLMVSKGKDTNIITKNNTFGILGSIGLKGFITNKISYSTNLRYEYDITSADNYKFGSYAGSNISEKSNVRNFRIGLELGLQYHFSLKSCKICDYQRH